MCERKLEQRVRGKGSYTAISASEGTGAKGINWSIKPTTCAGLDLSRERAEKGSKLALTGSPHTQRHTQRKSHSHSTEAQTHAHTRTQWRTHKRNAIQQQLLHALDHAQRQHPHHLLRQRGCGAGAGHHVYGCVCEAATNTYT